MTIEVAILISAVSASFAIYFGLANKKRSDNADVGKQVAEQTAILTKLEFIDSGIKDIKADINNLRTDMKDMTERIIKLEESDKTQWIQIDKLNNERHSK